MALYAGGDDGVSYLTVYLIERTLSLDNLVVFLLIFGSFAVPQEQRGKLLFWGIVLALVMRGLAIVVGVGLIERFHFVIYVLGVGLLVLAWKMWQGSAEHTDPHNNPLVKLVSRIFPVSDYEGSRFSLKRDGRRFVTPLALALVAVVAADIAFAIDSIPAAFAITDNPLVIWTANGFALLGLRALFALVEELVKRFRYLNQTVAIVLGVVAVKLLIQDLWKMPAAISLLVVVALFAGGIWLSARADRRDGVSPAH
jgi:tellurite resistance protein TerC